MSVKLSYRVLSGRSWYKPTGHMSFCMSVKLSCRVLSGRSWCKPTGHMSFSTQGLTGFTKLPGLSSSTSFLGEATGDSDTFLFVIDLYSHQMEAKPLPCCQTQGLHLFQYLKILTSSQPPNHKFGDRTSVSDRPLLKSQPSSRFLSYQHLYVQKGSNCLLKSCEDTVRRAHKVVNTPSGKAVTTVALFHAKLSWLSTPQHVS